MLGVLPQDMPEITLQAPAEGPETRYEWINRAWAHRWPSEEIWKARKR